MGALICDVCDDGKKDVTIDGEGACVMLDDGCTGVEPKGSGLDIKICSCVARLWRRWRRNPKITKTMRARPPITPPTTAPTGVELLTVTVVPEVTETTLVGVEEVACEDTDVVVDDNVPFWTMR